MEVKERKLENATRELTVTVPAEEIIPAFEKEFQKIQRSAAVDGFRKGKAPIDVIRQKYSDTARQGVIEELIRANYVKALEELKMNPIDHPKIDFEEFKDDAPFTFTALVEVYPTVELKEYTGISAEELQVKVSDDDVKTEIDGLREKHAQILPKEEGEASAEGDLVKVRAIQSEHYSEDSENGYNDISVIAGRGDKPYEFDQHVIGLKKGDKKEVELEYPDDYQVEAIAGQKIKYTFFVDEVSKRDIPAADDEFAKDLEKYESFAELEKDTRENLEKYTSERARGEAKGAILDKIIEKAEYDIPTTMVDREKKAIFDRLKQRYQLNIDDQAMFAALMGMKAEEFEQKLIDEANKSIKTTLTLSEIGLKEKLEVSDEAYKEKLEEIAKQYNQSVEEIEKTIEKNGSKQHIQSDMLFDMAMDFIYDNAKIKKGKTLSAKEFLSRPV